MEQARTTVHCCICLCLKIISVWMLSYQTHYRIALPCLPTINDCRILEFGFPVPCSNLGATMSDRRLTLSHKCISLHYHNFCVFIDAIIQSDLVILFYFWHLHMFTGYKKYKQWNVVFCELTYIPFSIFVTVLQVILTRKSSNGLLRWMERQ